MKVFAAPIYNKFIDEPWEEASHAVSQYIEDYKETPSRENGYVSQQDLKDSNYQNSSFGWNAPEGFADLQELFDKRQKYKDRVAIYAIAVVPWVIDLALIIIKCAIALISALASGAKQLICGAPAKSAHHRR